MHGGMEWHRRAVALFRYGLLAQVSNGPSDRAAALIRAQAGRVWEIPGSGRILVAEETIYGCLRLHGKRGSDRLLQGPVEKFARRNQGNSQLKGVRLSGPR